MPSAFYSSLGRTLIGFGLFFVCGCNFDYYLHLARGQSRVIFNRTPIAEITARPTLADKTRSQFELIQSILHYAESLELETGDNYTTYYDTGDKPISWNVSASPPERFEAHLWEFPFVGAVPYKGFFKLDLAILQRDTLIAKGYDSILRPVSAYSTLGFFSDPILSGMLNYQPDQLADLILHELTHATAYAPGKTDFNETMATFVGHQGSLLFLTHHFGADTPLLQLAQQRRADSALFRSFMVETVASLDSLYSLELPRAVVMRQRTTVFAQRKLDFALIRSRFSRNSYDAFLDWKLNNARLLSYRRYHSDLDLFAAVYRHQGADLASTIRVFAQCADQDDPWQCLRNAGSLSREPGSF